MADSNEVYRRPRSIMIRTVIPIPQDRVDREAMEYQNSQGGAEGLHTPCESCLGAYDKVIHSRRNAEDVAPNSSE